MLCNFSAHLIFISELLVQVRAHDLVPAHRCGTEVVLQEALVASQFTTSTETLKACGQLAQSTFRLLRREELTLSDNFTMVPCLSCASFTEVERELDRAALAYMSEIAFVRKVRKLGHEFQYVKK